MARTGCGLGTNWVRAECELGKSYSLAYARFLRFFSRKMGGSRKSRDFVKMVPFTSNFISRWGFPLGIACGSDSASCPGLVTPLKNAQVGAFIGAPVRDLPLYPAALRRFTADHEGTGVLTDAALRWWRNHGPEVGSRSEAARFLFAFTPNSASGERVFSPTEVMLGGQKDLALGETLQAYVMIRYSKRDI